MLLAAYIDPKIVPRVCAHDLGKSFEEITENDWCDYFLSAREVQELDLDSVAKAMASLKVDMKFCDAESRVGRLLADFYDKLEQLDVAHLPEKKPKHCDGSQARSVSAAAIWRKTAAPITTEESGQRGASQSPGDGRYKRLVCEGMFEVYKVLKCRKCQPGEILDQRLKKPHVAAVAATPTRRPRLLAQPWL
ncbi:hypothetical protein DYB25_013455 [Aphanomyces astaci]|uniref:Uncharacterized protein n=3 Tax=Aphanomyces astaci TaxID=112090 RepID=A0A397C6A2_APHAT|nr:hypothetical protein DYB25_013455 [Aphanomyces astaci]RHZ04796.1 hypothetical protein DYB26_001521 [Aphanomyces astaci]RHZ25832.1 hypothetical protein DYB31_002853 [Aphanomyces astaci]